MSAFLICFQSLVRSATIMFVKKLNNIFTSALPLYYYLKIFGIFLPSFTGSAHQGKLSVKLWDKFWFFTIYFTMAWMLFLNLKKDTHFTTSTSILLVIAWETCAITGLINVLIIQIYQYIYANEIGDTLSIIHEFDEKVCSLKHKIVYGIKNLTLFFSTKS